MVDDILVETNASLTVAEAASAGDGLVFDAPGVDERANQSLAAFAQEGNHER